MYPQSELDNYKLQVELLQDKLKHSEDNRRQLEQQLEKTLHKRNEHDKQMRAKTRQKYQQFLDEQQKRNERNKTLVSVLERIDQQTAAMSARSERLKMMKLQYEMYFAKLVQTQTRQCIQNTAPVTNTPIPVLLPTAATATATAATSVVDKSPTVDMLTPRGWTLAMATPTPAGMLVTSAASQAIALPIAPENIAASNPYNYLQQPIAYMPRLQQQQLVQQQLLQLRPAEDMLPMANLNDCSDSTVATLSAFDKMSDVLATLTPTATTTTTISTPIPTTTTAAAITLTQPQFGSNANNFSLSAPAGNNPDFMSTTVAPATASIYKTQQWQEQQREQQLSTLSPTYSTSTAAAAAAALTPALPLTFDKLPKNPLTVTEGNFSIANKNNAEDVATSSVEKPQIAAFEDRGKYDGLKMPPHSTHNFDYENAATVAASVTNSAIVAADGAYVVATPKATLRVHEPTVSQFDGTPKILEIENNSSNIDTNITNIIKKADIEAHHQNVSAGFAQLPTANANKPTEATEMPDAAAPGNQSFKSLPLTPANVSIENIENAIYGELLNPADELPPERFDNYLTQTQQPINATTTNQENTQENLDATAAQPKQAMDYAAYATVGGEDTTISSLSYNQEVSDSYEPTYATIDDNAGLGEGLATAENVYGDQTAGAEYAQYTNEGQGENGGDAQQVYDSNLDYSNYGAYDPNAYPGYTYDEATGQYTPDPNQQYDGSEAQYNMQAYDQQQYDTSQVNLENYDYANYGQSAEPQAADAYANQEEITTEPATMDEPVVAETEAEVAATSTPAQITEVGSSVEAEVKSAKPPHSILSTSNAPDKQAVPNDAHKKKKRVNFVDSSETDDSSSVKAPAVGGANANTTGNAGVTGGGGQEGVASSESDFDFSTSTEQVGA